MGLLKAITDAIKEKAKEEIVQYLKKIAEENAAKPAPANKPQERHDHKPQERRDERKPYPPQGGDPNGKFDRNERTDRYDRNDKYDNRFDKYADKYNDKFNAPKYDNRNDRNDKYDNRSDRYEKNDKYDNGNKYDGGNKYDSRNDRPAYSDQKPLPKPEPRPEHRPEPKPEFKQAERPPLPKPEVKPAPIPAPVAAPIPAPQPRPEVKPLPKKEEIILPLNEEPIEKVQMVVRGDDIILPYDLARLIQPLPVKEYSLYIKLYLYSFGIRKNYGYVGAGLKKSIGLDEMDAVEFGRLLDRLEKRGMVLLDRISDHQSTYILYLPFDENTMKLVEEKKPEPEPALAPKSEPKAPAAKAEPKPAPKGKEKGKNKEKVKEPEKAKEPEKGKGKGKEPEKGRGRPDDRQRGKGKPAPRPEPEKKQPAHEELPDEPMIPGKMAIDMDDDALMKAYRTFVSMEIDKAKMRVGRSNFDKIYMEAVKYIDKKYGFKVLSDQERFREYLTQYYISAFDIPNYDNWKKAKG